MTTAARIRTLTQLRHAEGQLGDDALAVLLALAHALPATATHTQHDASVNFWYGCLRCLALRASEVVADADLTAALTPGAWRATPTPYVIEIAPVCSPDEWQRLLDSLCETEALWTLGADACRQWGDLANGAAPA